jgi:cellulose synthase (UDP-forming)
MSETLPPADAPGAPPAGGASTRPRPGASRAEAGLRALFTERLAGRRAVLLLAAGEAESSGRAAAAAVELASAAARFGRSPVLADLGFQRPSLHQALGLLDGAGVTDAVFDGLSISEAARPVQGRGLRFLPAGAPVADLDELLSSFGTGPLLHGDPDPGLLLFLYVPAGSPGLRELAREVGAALVFAGPDAPRESWGLPDECRVYAVLAPAAAPRRRPPPSPGEVASPPAEAPAAEVVAPAGIAPPFADAAASAGEDRSVDEVSATAEPAPDLVASVDPFPADARTEAAEAAPAVGTADADQADADIADAGGRDSDRIHPERPGADGSDFDRPAADRSEAVPADADRADAVPAVAWEDRPVAVPLYVDADPGILAEVATLAQVPDRDLRDGFAPDIVPVEVEQLVPEFDAVDADPALAQVPEEDAGRPSRRGRRGRQDEGGALARYVVPRQAEWKEWLIRAQAVLTLVVWTYYIVWRWGWTLNPDHLWFAIPLALAETWGLISGFLFVHSVWSLKHRAAVKAPPGLTADVLIPCYDEPLEVIRRTAVGARNMRYPHRTWILDDGKRDEVRAMAEEAGVGYLRRETNEHAKAGNLNHGLANTEGEFVLVLDADHVALPHMLDRLLGILSQDRTLAFVQSPQDFYNTDAFTYEVDETGRRMWEEQRLFFSVLQPGKDARGAAFFCGSAAVLRRAALEEIGGFSHHSITEDIETSLRLHARGWKSAFYGESLAYGLAAGSAVAFHTQHLRWGQGAMQVIKRFNPLFTRGLTLSQRLSYFASLTAYVGGLQKLVFLLAPIVYFLTGILPIRALNAGFLARFLPVLALTLVMSMLLSRGIGNLLISERFHVAKFWTYTRAVFSILRRKPLSFKVTPKGPGHVPFGTYAPQAVLMGVTAATVAFAFAAARFGWVDYGWEGTRSPGFVANMVWAALNFVLASSVVQMSLRIRQQRADHRFRDQFPIHVRMRSAEGTPHSLVALTENLNPGGVGFRTGEPMRVGTEVRLTLSLTTGTMNVRGRIVHSSRIEGTDPPMYRSGAAFVGLPVPVRDAIELHCTQHAVPLEQSRYRTALRFLERAGERVRNLRGETRHAVQLPAQVMLPRGSPEHAGGSPMAFLEDLSESGARLVMDRPVSPGTPIRFRVPGTSTERTGKVVFSRAIETPIGVRYAVGVAHTGGALKSGYGRKSGYFRAASRILNT